MSLTRFFITCAAALAAIAFVSGGPRPPSRESPLPDDGRSFIAAKRPCGHEVVEGHPEAVAVPRGQSLRRTEHGIEIDATPFDELPLFDAPQQAP